MLINLALFVDCIDIIQMTLCSLNFKMLVFYCNDIRSNSVDAEITVGIHYRSIS